jgi:hypothetical protein
MPASASAKRPQKTAGEDGRPSKLRGSRKKRIRELLEKIEQRLEVQETKISVADFIRLTQLERELEQEEQPREIIVTWKDPSETNVG